MPPYRRRHSFNGDCSACDSDRGSECRNYLCNGCVAPDFFVNPDAVGPDQDTCELPYLGMITGPSPSPPLDEEETAYVATASAVVFIALVVAVLIWMWRSGKCAKVGRKLMSMNWEGKHGIKGDPEPDLEKGNKMDDPKKSETKAGEPDPGNEQKLDEDERDEESDHSEKGRFKCCNAEIMEIGLPLSVQCPVCYQWFHCDPAVCVKPVDMTESQRDGTTEYYCWVCKKIMDMCSDTAEDTDTDLSVSSSSASGVSDPLQPLNGD